MNNYPVYLRLTDKKVLLVGAGAVAHQKLPSLLEAGARVLVVAPKAAPEIETQAKAGRVAWQARAYETTDLDGAVLAIAATDDEALQTRVAEDCRARGVWVNVVDVPPLCDFIAPAVVRRGDIQVAISTGGAAPALAKYLRRKLEPVIGPEYAQLARMARDVRPQVLQWPKPQRAAFWEKVVSEDFIEMIRKSGAGRAEAQLKEWMDGRASL